MSGMKVGVPIDIRTGFDLTTSKGRKMVTDIVQTQEPDLIVMEPVCGPWSNMQNLNGMNTVWEKREKLRPMVEFVVQLAKYQHRHGRYFLIENPLTSRIWYEHSMASLLALPGVTYGDLDMCVFGARDPESHKLVLKPTSLMHNFEPGVLSPIFRRCSNNYLSKKHEHQHLEGQAKGFGSRTSIQQVYSYKICKTLAACFQQFLNVRPSNRITSLFVDLIEDMSDRVCSSLLFVDHQSIKVCPC